MQGMTEKKIPSAWPLYAAAAAFLILCAVLPVYRLWALAAALAGAAVAGVLTAKLVKPRVVLVPTVYETGQKELDEMLARAQRDLQALHALGERIADEGLQADIRRMETAGNAILQQVAQAPEKGRSVRKFAAYYLPTSVKVLTQYAQMTSSGASGEHAKSVAQEVKQNATIIAQAFEAQLDALFAGVALDVSTDLDVLEAMAKGDGLHVADGAGQDEQPKDPQLEL